MWNYLHRWKVANALYHLGRRYEMVVWVPEYQLCAWISGVDMKTHTGPDTFLERLRYAFWYRYFKVKNHDQLFQKIHNILYDMEHIQPAWVKRTKGDDGISDYVALAPRGNEVYAFSHLWLTCDPAQKIWTAALAGMVIFFATERISDIPQQQSVEVQVRLEYPTDIGTAVTTDG